MVLHKTDHKPGDGHADYLFFCPGCECAHGVWTTNPNGMTGATWTFNDNMEKPTFNPSLLVRWDTWEPPVTPENMDEFHKNKWEQTRVSNVCHSYVRDGMIQFLPDCTHKLAGQTVPLSEF